MDIQAELLSESLRNQVPFVRRKIRRRSAAVGTIPDPIGPDAFAGLHEPRQERLHDLDRESKGHSRGTIRSNAGRK